MNYLLCSHSERIISTEKLVEIVCPKSTYNAVFDSPEPRFSLFLGAGASFSSNIKLANQMIKYFVEIIFDFEQKQRNQDAALRAIADKEKRYKKGFKLAPDKRKRFEEEILNEKKEYLKSLPGYGKCLKDESEYSFFFRKCYEKEVLRRDYIESLIKSADFSWGYIQLANLIKRDVFRIILTTNFDDLVYQSCTTFTDKRPAVFSYGGFASEIVFSTDRAQVFKLHGDFLYSPLLNTIEDFLSSSSAAVNKHFINPVIAHLKNKLNMREAFKQTLQEGKGIVVIGYAGADKSIMDIFESFPADHYLLWCVVWEDVENLTPQENNRKLLESLDESVLALLAKKKGQIVKIKGFDEVIAKICEVETITNQDILISALQRASNLRTKLYKLKYKSIKALSYTPTEEKKKEQEYKKEVDKVFYDFSRFLLGYTAYLNEEYLRAFGFFLRSTRGNRYFADAHYNFGNLLADELMMFELAEKSYRQAIEINPQDAYAYNRLGKLLTNSPNKDWEAKIYLLKAIELKRDFDFAYYNLGYWFQRKWVNNWRVTIYMREAERNFKKALEINPEFINPLISLLMIYRQLQQKKKQRKVIKRIIRLLPNDDFYNWACFFATAGNKDKAIEILKIAVKTAVVKNDVPSTAISMTNIKKHYVRAKARDDLNFLSLRSDRRFEDIVNE